MRQRQRNHLSSTHILNTQRDYQDRMPRVVIVGAGFGGLEAALKLGKAPAWVTVIDRNNHYVFQPLL